jgi:hypothetical protein
MDWFIPTIPMNRKSKTAFNFMSITLPPVWERIVSFVAKIKDRFAAKDRGERIPLTQNNRASLLQFLFPFTLLSAVALA